MKKTLLLSGVAVLLTLLLTNGKSQSDLQEPESAVSGTQWEYMIVAGGNFNISSSSSDKIRKQPDMSFNREYVPLERNMDKLGALGWELVSVFGTSNEPIFYFKRPKTR